VVLQGSTAVPKDRPSAQQQHPFVVTRRKQLLADGTLVPKGVGGNSIPSALSGLIREMRVAS